jgi:sarcosine oxidase
MCYYEHPDYVPLLRRAYELWHELERHSGASLLTITGGVYIGPPGSEVVEGSARVAREHALGHEVLSHADLARRFRQFHLPAGSTGLFEPDAGYLVPERVISAHLELALRHGAAIRGDERVTSWRADAGTVEVVTSRATYRAKRLVITAGAWAQGLAGPSFPVRPTRQVMGWVSPRSPEPFRLGNFPFWAIDVPNEGMYYGFPIDDTTGQPGLKIARHVPGPPIEPDNPDRAPRAQDEADFRSALTRFLPDADGPLLALRVCMYENSPDSHFLIDRHPDHPNVFVAAGFSGHGFKFATVIGEILADLVRDGCTPHPIGFLSTRRLHS